MRHITILLIFMALASGAIAQDLGYPGELPVKNKPIITYIPPAEVKQGGDTIGDATTIPGLPYSDSGTTDGFIDDYDEECPHTEGSTSPDVVYSFSPDSDVLVNVDLCGSDYDTKTYIYDSGQNLLFCSDDFYYPGDPCGDWTSKIVRADLVGGETYFIVIDGYGGESGLYELNITETEECFVTCPADAVAEGEPPIGDGYIDNWNGGCTSNPPVFQSIDWINDEDGVPPYDGIGWLCGKSGFYPLANGLLFGDIDWFIVTALETGEMEFTIDSEGPLEVYKLSPVDCDTWTIDIFEVAYCGEPVTMTFQVTEGEELWLATQARGFQFPNTEFTYFATLSGHYWIPPVPNEDMSWGGVKALYR